MKSHPATAQIIYASKELQWDCEMISSQLEIPLVVVQEILSLNSGLSAIVSELNSPEEIIHALKSLARSAESEKVREAALKYLHAELTGRNNIERENLELKKVRLQLDAVDVGMRLKQFNTAIERARKLKESIAA